MLRSLGRLAPGRLRMVHVMWRWDMNKETRFSSGLSSGLQGLRDPPALQPFVLVRTHTHTHTL